MATGNPTFNPFSRARAWLLDKDGFHAKVLGAAGISLASVILLAVVFVLIAVHASVPLAAGSEQGHFETLKLVALIILGITAIGALFASTWNNFKIHSLHIAKVEHKGNAASLIIESNPDAILTVDVEGI